MEKKEKQWHIDRAVTDLEKQELRIRRILELLSSSESITDKDDLLGLMVNLGLISSENRYKQSFQTFLKDYGLINEKYKVSNVANYYLENKINFKDLLFLQAFKKQYKRNESFMIRPLVVICKVFLSIYEKDKDNAWIDEYDYFKYLTEIVNYDQLDLITQRILSDKQKNVSRNHEFKKHDFDAWIKLLIFLGFFEYRNGRLYICEENIDLYYFIANEHDNAPMIEKDDDWIEMYSSFDEGLPMMLKRLEFKSTFSLNNIAVDEREILRLYLFKGLSFRKIEEELNISNINVDLKGFLAQAVVKSYGIVGNEFKGIWKGLEKYKNIIVASDIYKNEKLFLKLFDCSSRNSHLNGKNKLFYGIPGCGKSYMVNSILAYQKNYTKYAEEIGVFGKVKDENIFRTTFYLEYSNSDFIGQIYPHVEDENVNYILSPGPFTLALERAYTHENEMIYLVIEEINRGNAAAIFGDIFQLLDRLKENRSNYIKGDSEYPINNVFIQDYLKSKKIDYHGSKIYIPHNMTILATMNTCDQNVFPLDTAFQRRWEKYKIKNNWDYCDFKNYYIPFNFSDEKINWMEFVDLINKKILESNNEIIQEDKQIGAFFVDKSYLMTEEELFVVNKELNENILLDKQDKFCYKILDYLWNDVSKLNRHNWFGVDIRSFDQLCEKIRQCDESWQFYQILGLYKEE
ncbi:MAG: AAA family ATPase [Coprobacillus cateniformis]|nr:AAA family ATPase [Coprobacillus cateniformis]